MSNSTKGSRGRKRGNDFPLTERADGRFCKNVRTVGEDGLVQYKMHYFQGPKEEALREWLRIKDHLLAGVEAPSRDDEAVTVGYLVNAFLEWKRGLRDQKDQEIAPRTYKRYEATGKMLIAKLKRGTVVGHLNPRHFEKLRSEMAAQFGAVALANEIQTVRSIFAYGVNSELLDKPASFGLSFEKPSAATIRSTRPEGGTAFHAKQILAVMDLAGPAMKAMTLLGINGGLGNTEVATLTESSLDLVGGWLSQRRVKTKVERRIPLWPETVAAIRDAIARRIQPKDVADADLIFIGGRGESYVGDHKGYRVSAEFSRLLDAAKIADRSFYDLRRTFQTEAENVTEDFIAVSAIMGHAPKAGDMAARYRQKISDERLRAVTDGLRGWLFPETVPAPEEADERAGGAQPAKGKAVKSARSKKRPSAEFVEPFQLRIVG